MSDAAQAEVIDLFPGQYQEIVYVPPVLQLAAVDGEIVDTFVPFLAESPVGDQLPLVFTADLLETESYDQLRTQHLIGRAVLGKQVEVKTVDYDPKTLAGNIQLASVGDPIANKKVDASCQSDLMERGYKSGILVETELHEEDNGDIHQHGLPMEAVFSNTLQFAAKHPVINQIAQVEALNGYRLNSANQMGILDDYVMVMESLVSDQLTIEEAARQNFFTDTMTASWQMVTKVNGKLVHYSASVAGVKEPGAERHDIKASDHLGANFGQDRRELTTLERLAKPQFIHKSLIPNGPIDIVRILDQANGTFFGQKHDGPEPTLEDYQAHVERGQLLQANMRATAEQVKKRLLAEAQQIKTPLDAIERLDRISEEELVRTSLSDYSIEPMVFGSIAAAHIVEARHWQIQGETHMMQASMKAAQATADSSACPGEINSDRRKRPEDIRQKDSNDAGDGLGPKKFKCKNGHDNERPFGDYVYFCEECKENDKDKGKSVRC